MLFLKNIFANINNSHSYLNNLISIFYLILLLNELLHGLTNLFHIILSISSNFFPAELQGLIFYIFSGIDNKIQTVELQDGKDIAEPELPYHRLRFERARPRSAVWSSAPDPAF